MNPSEFVRTYFDTFNRHDWEKLASMYSPSAEFKDPSLGPGVVKQSREDFIGKYSGLSEAFSDMKNTVIAIYPSGDKNIIVEFVSSGTAPDGTKFELPICTIFEIENGLITKDFTYYDNLEE
ncbi:MAG: nuclear transport factor 2 family protein [Zoogloeaceae bacterium]|jgi:ketosteroid isomerase-like protein|nr:nuclear transport factor 2 family protein [Zoogloeaceae bacterium]